MAFEDRFQNQRLVVLLIPRAVHEGDGVFFALLLKQSKGILLLAQFLPITDLELLSFGRIVTEPLAQLRPRGHVLQPQFYRRALFGQTARPQAIDDHQRKDKRVSNEEWMSPTDPDNGLLAQASGAAQEPSRSWFPRILPFLTLGCRFAATPHFSSHLSSRLSSRESKHRRQICGF